MALGEYSFDVEYTPATKIRHADALSRVMWPEDEETNSDPKEDDILGEWKELFGPEPERSILEKPSDKDKIPSDEFESTAPDGAEVNLMFGDVQDWELNVDFSEWGQAQKNDPGLKEKYAQARNDPDHPYLALKDEVLYQLFDRQYLPLAPKCFRKFLLKKFHGPPAMGHQGLEKVYATMKKYVFWPGMRKDIADFIEVCDICQRHKRNYLRVPMQNHCVPPRPFHTVSMDVIGPVVKSEYQERYILVMQDMLTRWVELAPMRTQAATLVLDKFMAYWVARYGPPERLLTDRGSNLVGHVVQKYCRFFGIYKIHTTVYHPQSNGANERMHQELTKYFSMYLDDDRKDKWRWLLSDAAYAYNTSHHTALGASPYEVLFGQLPPLGPLGIPTMTGEEESGFEEYYGKRREELVELRKHAQDSLAKAQDKSVQYANRHAHVVPFKIGDYVLYKNHNKETKFDAKYTGPWKIIDQISPVVFELDLGGVRFSAHAKTLKPYKGEIPEEMSAEKEEEGRLIAELDSEEQGFIAMEGENLARDPLSLDEDPPEITASAEIQPPPTRVQKLKKVLQARIPKLRFLPRDEYADTVRRSARERVQSSRLKDFVKI
jgi:transposase InsO family protein